MCAGRVFRLVPILSNAALQVHRAGRHEILPISAHIVPGAMEPTGAVQETRPSAPCAMPTGRKRAARGFSYLSIYRPAILSNPSNVVSFDSRNFKTFMLLNSHVSNTVANTRYSCSERSVK